MKSFLSQPQLQYIKRNFATTNTANKVKVPQVTKNSHIKKEQKQDKIQQQQEVQNIEEPIKHKHQPMKQTFHVGMLLLGSGTQGENERIGTNLHEVISLRIALSFHKIQVRYFSLDGIHPLDSQAQLLSTLSDNEPKMIEEQDQQKPQENKQIVSNYRNMMIESARITRGSKGLYEVKNMKVDSLKALIIPSFLDQFDEELVQAVVNVPEIRDCIKECNMKQKFLLPVGASAISLVGKSLKLPLKPFKDPKTKDHFKHFYLNESRILGLPYDQNLIDEAPENLGKLHSAIASAVLSLKSRVNQ